MADVVSKAVRSRMMSGIKGVNTRPEMLVRRFIHGKGYRYRLHCKELAGRPDLVLTKHRLVIFVHGCFWHGHSGCSYFKLPRTNRAFWSSKIGANRKRDTATLAKLKREGWRIAVVWECSLRKAPSRALDRLLHFLSDDTRFLST